MNTAKLKHQTSVRSVAEYIAWQINLCGKSQMQIASEIGFDKPNIITMIKQGKTKLPLDKVGKFAKAIGVDPIFLYQLVMAEYLPDTWNEIQRVIGQPALTLNELEFIEAIRQSNVVNPKLHTATEKQKLIAFVDGLKSDN